MRRTTTPPGQRDLLTLLEPAAFLPAATRQRLVALLATLLLEAATAAEERGDEQDHR
jgi:hypothetical protein